VAKAYFPVRAEVPEVGQERFDHWYATGHLPWAKRAFGALRPRRCRSHNETVRR
jgi:hypothetical protein